MRRPAPSGETHNGWVYTFAATMDDLITAAEAARLLHLHVKRVQHLARTGQLPATRFGHKWLFSRSKLLAAQQGGSGKPRERDEESSALDISARNRLRGRIAAIVADGVMAEVRIEVADQEIVSIITRTSVERMRLEVGDEVFAVVKYRLLAANESNGNYILTAFLASSLPTATNNNGQPKSVITPTLAYGKGWGMFDMQGTIAAAEPAGETSVIGRTYTWNHSFQLRLATRFWPELEVNQNWFSGGKNDGKEQTFLTPGLVIGKLPLTDRVGLTFGAGVQMAVSQFHTTNHNIIVSTRFPF